MPKTRSISVIKADEPWLFVHLADGTILKHRMIIMGVIQLLNDNGEPLIDESGCGQYAIQNNIVHCIEHSPMIDERQIENNKRNN